MGNTKSIKKMFVPVAMLATMFTYIAFTGESVNALGEKEKNIDVTINGNSKTLKTDAKTVKDVLSDIDYKYKTSDQINYMLDTRLMDEMEIIVKSQKNIKFSSKDLNETYTTNAVTVGEFLEEIGVKLSDKDIVIPSLDSKLKKDEEILIIQHEEKLHEEISEIDYKVNSEFSIDIPMGETKVVTKGQKGKIKITHKEQSKNGIIISSEILSVETIQPVIDEVVLIGVKEVVTREIDFKVVEKQNSSMSINESKVVQHGQKGVEELVYYNDGKTRQLVSQNIAKKPIDKIVEKGTKEKQANTQSSSKTNVSGGTTTAKYSLSDFRVRGVIHDNGKKFTYYSQSVLPGGGLKIPGRHVNSGGYVSDGDGYIVLASNRSISKGTIINTPFGYQGKVYDVCPECSTNWFDVYTK